jgi:hypothetical protein
LPDSRHKYLYERLGDHDFQQLVGALLSERFPDFVPLPLRQADGGRDGVQLAPENRLVYQVKWSAKGSEKKPVEWLDATIANEAHKIKRLVSEGTKKYAIVTNVPSTGTPGTGTFDRLNAKLERYSQEYGIEMIALWREAVNAMVDSAPTETKWAYAEMLAGWDLVRYLISEQTEAQRDSSLRELLRRVAAAQWDEDDRIKFSQVELNREHLTELFVDVSAERIHIPNRARSLSAPTTARLGGAAGYITKRSRYPFTLVLGAPGQGKSTLGQLVSQAFRAAFMPTGTVTDGLPVVGEPRFPLRIDLGDYAAWMEGYDVFDQSDASRVKKGRKRPASQATIECFLAELMTHAGGGDPVLPRDVHELFDRLPSLVVLDGLDEVGSAGARNRVVDEINLLCARGKSYAVEPRVVVTSRPNSAGLAEPDREMFEVIALSPMEPALRDEYLRKWCAVYHVRGPDSRTLRRNFLHKTREPYIGELAGNPMQLTILLFLLRQQGDATPDQRTELYDAYMNLLLAREANKHPESVRKYRNELMEIVPFLGWYLQSRAEEHGHSGRMAYAEVEAAMKHFQRTYGKPEDVVDDLFEAATDRLWALTSKEEGTFEFEVLSLREYFAARYLYRYSGEGDPRFDRTVVFRELLRRPYWLNTTRFYAGNAAGSDLYVLQAGISHELTANTSKQVRVASWSLITDGVFNNRPQVAASIVDALIDGGGGDLLLTALDGKEVTPLPESSHATAAWQRLTAAISADPDDPSNYARVRILRQLLGLSATFATWWVEQLQTAIGTNKENAWLAIGAECEVVAGHPIDLPGLRVDDGERAQLLLNTGAISEDGGPVDTELFRAVLDGQCSETTTVRSGPARVAVALSPAEFYAFGSESKTVGRTAASSSDRRSQAIQLLRKSGSPYAYIAGLRRFRRGEKGTTFPWANTSTALVNLVGRCWLATELALIGAASPLRDGWTIHPGDDALGPTSHPAALIAQTRANKSNSVWWRQRLAICDDDLGKAEWAFALWAVAEGHVIEELFPELQQLLDRLPARLQRAMRIASLRLGQFGFLTGRPVSRTSTTELVAQMLAARGANPPTTVRSTASNRPAHGQPIPLAAVARSAKWLKVDRTPTYR